MVKLDKGTRLLFFFAGASSEYAHQLTPSDILKIKLLGAAPLVPACIAYAGTGYAISTYYTGAPFLTWCVAAPLVAGIVFFIEVLMNATLSPGFVSLKKGVMGIPRILFSIVLSLTLALSPKIAIFNGPIQRQISRQKQEEIHHIKSQVDPLVQEKGTARDQAQMEFNKKEAECSTLRMSYLLEVDGREGSTIRGYGPAAQTKKEAYDECRIPLNEYRSALVTAKLRYEEALHKLEQSKMAEIQKLEQASAPDLMEQLAAWKVISNENSMLKFFGVVIFLLFAFLDFIPTWAKLTTNVPSYVFAERAEHRKKMVNLHAHLQAFKRVTEERSQALEDIAVKKRQVRMYHTLLWARLRKMDAAYKIRRELENRSNLQQMAEQLDMDPFRQTVSDVTEFQDVSQPLDEGSTEGGSTSSSTKKSRKDHSPHKPKRHSSFNLKRIA